MPKKSKKSRSTDPDLPDLETRRANLLAIGMPSPYQGETTSSSSLDDSSSSTTANETEDSSKNSGRLERAADDLTAIACYSAEDGKKSTGDDESPVLTITSLDAEPQRDLPKSVGIISEQTSSILVIDPQPGYTSVERNTSTTRASITSDQSYQNLLKDYGTKSSEASSIISLEQPSENPSCAVQEQKDPKLSKSIECVKENPKLSPTINVSQKSKKNKRGSEDSKNLEYITYESFSKQKPSAKHTAEKTGMSEVETQERTIAQVNLMPDASSKEKIYKITATKCMTDVSSKERAKTKTPPKKEVSSKERSKSIIPTKSEVSSKGRSKSITPTKTEVSSKMITPTKIVVLSKERSIKITPTKTEVSSKERSKSISTKTEVPSKERSKSISTKTEVSSKERSKSISTKTEVSSKNVTPTKIVVSSKETSKSVTPTKTKVSSKERSKSVTPNKHLKEISPKEKAKGVLIKYTTEVSSKEKSKGIEPVNVSLEGSREKYERALSPTKYSLTVPLEGNIKTAISTKPILETSSRKNREKTETLTTVPTESRPKEKTKTVTPTKCTPQVLSKKRLKSVTPTKCTGEVSSKEKITLKPTKHKPDASSQEKCEKTYTQEASLKEKKTVTPVKHASKDSSKERSKPLTPTKRMAQASSNESRERNATPSKRKSDVPPKGETVGETKRKKASVALSKEKFEVMIQTKCTPEVPTESVELKPNKRGKNTMVASSLEKVKKPVAKTSFIEEKSCREKVVKPVTPTKSSRAHAKESPIKHSSDGSHAKFKKPDMHGLPEDYSKTKDSECTEQNIISFKDFKEALGVDRVPPPDISLDVFDKAVGICEDSEKSSPNKSPEPQQETPVITTEQFLEALSMALDNLKLKIISLNKSKTETKLEPTSVTEPRVPHLTIEEFRRALGTDRITPVRTEDDLDVFNKALEKLEEKRRRRVTFLVPSEPAPSTSRVRTSPERQLTKLPQNTKPDSSKNQTLTGGTLTFEEFHRGLSTQGYIKPDLLNLDVFDKALEEMEKTNSSQPAQEVHKDPCRPNPIEKSNESDSSDEDINKSIAVSGMKMKRSRVVSSDDESKHSRKSDSSKKNRTPTRIGESKLRAPEVASQILEENSYLFESTSKPSEAISGESSVKSLEPELVSCESIVGSSESEKSLMEYIEKSPEEEVEQESSTESTESEASPIEYIRSPEVEVESSESAVKSTESEASSMECVKISPEEEVESSESAVKSAESEVSPEEYIGVFKESTELYDSERTSSFEKSLCEGTIERGEFSETPENTELESPEECRRSERILARVGKSKERRQRTRTQSENDLRKRRSGKKDSKPKKKRYSDEH